MKMRKPKRVRSPVLAAGGIVIRGGTRPRIAVVQRSKDHFWVLPKGKLKPNENPISAARREAAEETGHEVRAHEFLGAISYEVSGKPKIVHFWRMQASSGPVRKLTRDIKAVEWLSLRAAIERLTQPLESVFLDHIGGRALAMSRGKAGIPKKAPKRRGGRSRRKSANRRASSRKTASRLRRTPRLSTRPNVLRRLLRRLRPAAARRAT